MLRSLVRADGPAPAIDPRVARTITLIEGDLATSLSMSERAARVGLSEGRLRHLFRESTGVSISSYLLWTRIKAALRRMLREGAALGDAAHEAGFSDQAHFTRTFRRMFGVPPSVLLRHAEALEVFGA